MPPVLTGRKDYAIQGIFTINLFLTQRWICHPFQRVVCFKWSRLISQIYWLYLSHYKRHFFCLFSLFFYFYTFNNYFSHSLKTILTIFFLVTYLKFSTYLYFHIFLLIYHIFIFFSKRNFTISSSTKSQMKLARKYKNKMNERWLGLQIYLDFKLH